MFHADSNEEGGILTMSFAQHVDAQEMGQCLAKVEHLLKDMKPGFRLMTDLSSLESMDPDCATDLGAMMDLCDQKGIKAVLRVIPDPQKDIGFALLSHFHYGPNVELSTYESLADAISSIAH